MTTNFENITETPEKLAEFIDSLLYGEIACPEYVLHKEQYPNGCIACEHYERNTSCELSTLEWLQYELR